MKRAAWKKARKNRPSRRGKNRDTKKTMTCVLNWAPLAPQEWERKFNRLGRTNLLQSYEYARAVCPLYHQQPRWAVIELDGQDAGLLQVFEAGLFRNLIHAVMLDRGPLWFKEQDSLENFEYFLQAYTKELPKRPGRRRRFIPEMPDTPDSRALLKQYGFTRKNAQTYETFWLDLSLSEDLLRRNLKKNWRGALSKAEKSDISIEWDERGRHLEWLLGVYAQDKMRKAYKGPPPRLVRALAETFALAHKMLIGRAEKNGQPVAAVMLLCHGSSATYQLGWTAAAGRKISATHLLLWQSLKRLKNKNIRYFDLGGFNDTSKGLMRFKAGLGGEKMRLPGLYS